MPLKSVMGVAVLFALIALSGCDLIREIKERKSGSNDPVSISGSVLFSDDFEGIEVNPAWFVTSGEWAIQNGRLASGGGEVLLQVPGSTSWSDYQINVDISVPRDLGNVARVVFRAADTRNKIALQMRSDGLGWYTIADGNRNPTWQNFNDGTGFVPVALGDNFHLRIDVRGKSADFYIRQKSGAQLLKLASISFNGFTQGTIGLQVGGGLFGWYTTTFDNFVLTKLD